MKINIDKLAESRIAYFPSIGAYGEKQNKEIIKAFKK